MSRADTDDYANLFLRDTPMFDTRAPAEYEKGSFPHTASLPLMTDAERARVGTCYKREGQQAAIELGHQLVSGATREARLQQWLDFARAHPDGYLFCWRGGLRSQTVQQWLQDSGIEYPRVLGGYKAMRRFLIDTTERVLAAAPLVVIAGRTGCGKTDLLNGLPGSIDLEGLAHHRGSSFGRRPGGQPSQIDFENRLAIDLLRLDYSLPGRPILLEDESLLIGRCALPHTLRTLMASAPRVLVEQDLEARVEHSYRHYILDKLDEWQAELGPEEGFSAYATDLQDSLARLQRRLGGARHRELERILLQALEEQAAGESGLHREWIRILLRDYYDPMYDYQLSQKQELIVFRGPSAAVRDYLRALPGLPH
ncbi:tRNA 2-selenouridine(34) synthase MnmH [Parahaliea maris]|uniref:tRNA 2-selenouridine synthase n=1 Tax=Parahaliea maris TaxID=2716870 RepID=A0A5C9A2V5_9GAMM|nr:tRNA 2-selenouridine(34) synthase MnmH [Parahaliea maris]TXS95205.1 tRNA 2-selenouridine(34) synthase MnmH [Parahaliea maris]